MTKFSVSSEKIKFPVLTAQLPVFAVFLFILITGCSTNPQNIPQDEAGLLTAQLPVPEEVILQDTVTLQNEVNLQDNISFQNEVSQKEEVRLQDEIDLNDAVSLQEAVSLRDEVSFQEAASQPDVIISQNEVIFHEVIGSQNEISLREEVSLQDEISLREPQPSAKREGSPLDAGLQEKPKTEEPIESDANINTVILPVKKPMIALTFDDGPSEHTRSILELLERYGVRATFFVLGEKIEEWQDTIVYAANNGHEIAGHTWSHLSLTGLSNKAIEDSIKATSAMIEQVTGKSYSSFFRPPYGLVNQRVANVSSGIGYSLVGWTVDPQDWRVRNSNLIYNGVMNYVKENSIILLHDIWGETAVAMERILPALIARGYHLATVSELLNHVHGQMRPGRMYGNPGIVR